MAKRISTDAKIVLQNAGYHVQEVGNNRYGKPSFLKVSWGGFEEELSIVNSCIDNAPIEELIELAKRWKING